MRYYAPKIAAIAYLLWGVIHVVGGAAMLYAASSGLEHYFQLLAGNPATMLRDSAMPTDALSVRATQGIFAFHAYNVLWLGVLVGVVAVRMNWRNSATGYWLNMTIVGMADIGLLVFMVAPGVIPLTDAWIGPVLFVIAVTFATVGRFGRKSTAMSMTSPGQPLVGT